MLAHWFTQKFYKACFAPVITALEIQGVYWHKMSEVLK